eukprot:XP_023155848.1 uncharacterized protein LOC111589284 [Zea mays]
MVLGTPPTTADHRRPLSHGGLPCDISPCRARGASLLGHTVGWPWRPPCNLPHAIFLLPRCCLHQRSPSHGNQQPWRPPSRASLPSSAALPWMKPGAPSNFSTAAGTPTPPSSLPGSMASKPLCPLSHGVRPLLPSLYQRPAMVVADLPAPCCCSPCLDEKQPSDLPVHGHKSLRPSLRSAPAVFLPASSLLSATGSHGAQKKKIPQPNSPSRAPSSAPPCSIFFLSFCSRPLAAIALAFAPCAARSARHGWGSAVEPLPSMGQRLLPRHLPLSSNRDNFALWRLPVFAQSSGQHHPSLHFG